MIKILGYEIVNEEKFNRAVYGAVQRAGALVGGVGETAADEVKLAQYDKLGGLIKKNGRVVKMGSFWDFEKKKMRNVPEVKFIFRDLDGNVVELADGEKVPPEIIAAEEIQAKKVIKRGRPKKEDVEA